MNHLPYDAFNGSLVEQDLIHVVGNEEPPCGAIKKMAIDDIRPQEVMLQKWKLLKLLLYQIPLTTLMQRCSTPLLQISKVAVPHLRAIVPSLLHSSN